MLYRILSCPEGHCWNKNSFFSVLTVFQISFISLLVHREVKIEIWRRLITSKMHVDTMLDNEWSEHPHFVLCVVLVFNSFATDVCYETGTVVITQIWVITTMTFVPIPLVLSYYVICKFVVEELARLLPFSVTICFNFGNSP